MYSHWPILASYKHTRISKSWHAISVHFLSRTLIALNYCCVVEICLHCGKLGTAIVLCLQGSKVWKAFHCLLEPSSAALNPCSTDWCSCCWERQNKVLSSSCLLSVWQICVPAQSGLAAYYPFLFARRPCVPNRIWEGWSGPSPKGESQQGEPRQPLG